MLEYGLNGKAPLVYDVIDDGKRVRNQDETLAAGDRLDAIAARFATWVWEDPKRADRLAHAYNQRFNAIVPRRFDGTHLTFPGLDSGFEPYAHQRDMVARVISGADALCPYPVGTGKTATMFMAAIKLKALGLASKPLILVVPSTLEQIARDGKRLFPNARILMAGKEDLADARARKLFAARCAMEEWDAVVMSHPSFTSLPVHPTVQAGYVADLAAEYRSALISAKSESAEPRKIKQIARMVDNLEAEAKRLLRHATDDGVFFEHLGADYLLVDEMHYFKNLGVPVHTDGFTVNGSKRAQDLDMKLTWLRSRHPSHAVVTGFTGTPVSNTLLEAFVLQHYLQPERLAELGLKSADAWTANFVRFATAVEVTPDGGFKLNRRPAEIINIPDLVNTVGEFAELRPPESFPVARPDARRHNIAVEASDAVLEYVRSLAERADDIHAGGVPSSEDNILKICSDGRKVALHESLVGLRPDGPGKVDAVTANVARIYHETKDLELPGDDSGVRGRLQLVFCDLGTPNKDKGNQVYGLIRQQLIAAGVPAERIRFIHEATTDARRLVLFDQCNKGEINVLLGSTDKLGVGVNVQRRAIALHHVDAPWRPDQVEQRDGRVWRPKNLNPAVDIYRYVTEGSFDAFMWQALERKEKSLRPILAGQATARSVEDIGDIALDYGQIKAISTGNPLLTELNEVAFEVKRLTSLATSHQRTQRRLRGDIQTLTMQASAAVTTADALDALATAAARDLDTRWRDTYGNPLPKDGETAVLGTLAESTLAKGYCDGTVQWRGLTIDLTASKQWRDTELTARIATADHRRITVPLKATWAAKGQHWRIRDAIAAAVDEAHLTAAATRENIDVLKQRIAENEAASGQPFPDADALDAARARRVVLEAAIREQAQKDEEARRSRTPRAATTGVSAEQDGERRALLARLHTALNAVIERAQQQDQRPLESPGALATRYVALSAPEPINAPDAILAVASRNAAQDEAVLSDEATTTAKYSKEPTPHVDAAEIGIDQDQKDASGISADESATPTQPDARLVAERTAAAPETLPPTEVEGQHIAAHDPDDIDATPSLQTETSQQELTPQGVNGEPTDSARRSAAEPRRPGSTRQALGIPEGPRVEQQNRASRPSAHGTGMIQTGPEPPQGAMPASASLAGRKNARAGRKDPHRAARSARPAKRSPQFEHAIDLALQGFAVFPLRPGTKEPLIRQWEQRATADPRRIAQWWTSHPDANIAIACGPSNLLVIDLDTAKQPGDPAHGQQTLNTVAAGREVPRTFTVTSARGGRHLYYRQPDGAALRNTTGSDRTGLGPLIDTRGHGGYVVAPGSTVGSGTYRIEHDAQIAPLPTWIADELASRRAPAGANAQTAAPSHTPAPERRRSAYGGAALRRATDTVATAPEGTRNHTLNREAFRLGRLVGGGILDHDDAANTLRRAARKAGLAPREIENTIASGLAAGAARPRSIPNRTHPPQADRPTKEDSMAAITAQTPQAAGSAITAPPNPATLFPHLSAPGSRAFQDALRTLWRLGPTAIGLPETTAQPVRAAWQQAGEQMAAAIQQHEANKTTDNSGQTRIEASPAPQTVPAPHTTDPEPDEQIATDAEVDHNSDEIWTHVRASIERARQALPDRTENNTIDDVKAAIDEVLRYLADTPLPPQHPAGERVTIAPGENDLGTPTRSIPLPAKHGNPTDTESPDAEVPEQKPTNDLDGHLAAVDTAYAKAQSAGIPTTDPEWAGIRAIHTAAHTLWDTVKAAAGTYWAELAADTRMRGLLTALAIRAARAIANLASAAADRLEQRTSPQPTSAAPAEPSLREAYINARNQIRAHATSHEWQRITALWGTVNTLARQTDDPGIRAVVARSADAISDYADTLSRKTTQHGNHGGSTDALRALARAAERHAAALRGTEVHPEQWHGQAQSQGTAPSGTQPHSAPRPHQNADAQALRASARQVAQRVQARLGHASANATNAPLRPHNTAAPNGHAPAMRPIQPTTPRDSASVKVR